MDPWRKYDPGRFAADSAGGRGFCSVARCEQPAAWMMTFRKSRGRTGAYAYCPEHRESRESSLYHAGQRGCGCHVAIRGPEGIEIVFCATHAQAPALLAALEERVDMACRKACGFREMLHTPGCDAARAVIRAARGESV